MAGNDLTDRVSCLFCELVKRVNGNSSNTLTSVCNCGGLHNTYNRATLNDNATPVAHGDWSETVILPVQRLAANHPMLKKHPLSLTDVTAPVCGWPCRKGQNLNNNRPALCPYAGGINQ